MRLNHQLIFGSNSRSLSPRKLWLLSTIGIFLAVLFGWVAARQLQSSNQAVANVAPPEPSWVTASVDYRVLTQTVITRGDVVPQITSLVNVPESITDDPVVTWSGMAVNDVVQEGQRLIEISGRPVFVLVGAVPAFRLMRPGMSGVDIIQLQVALSRIGCTNNDQIGLFGEGTKKCVDSFYRQSGYLSIPSSPTESIDLLTANQAVTDANIEVEFARQALQRKVSGEQGSLLLEAQISLGVAQRAYITAVQSNSGLADATDQLRLAEFKLAEVQNPDATSEYLALDRAIQVQNNATSLRNSLQLTTGPTVPRGEIIFVPELPARIRSTVTSLGPIGASRSDATKAEDSSGNIVELSAGGLIVATRLRTDERNFMRSGTLVELLNEQTNISYNGKFLNIANTLSESADGQQSYLANIVSDEPLPPELVGVNLRVTIHTASTDSPTLVVPITAVSSTADGTTSLSVLKTGAESPELVAIEVGLSADGFVAVEPVNPGAVNKGDRVVVGR